MKVAVFFADGFEEIEAITAVDIIRRSEIEVETISINESNSVKGAHGVIVNTDSVISETGSFEEYDAIVIPGGLPGATNLRDSDKVIEAVRTGFKNEKLVSAICAGPIVLHKAGVLDGKNVTNYPGFEDELSGANPTGKGVEKDSNVITGKGPAYAMDFALEIVEYLAGTDKANEVKDGLLKK